MKKAGRCFSLTPKAKKKLDVLEKHSKTFDNYMTQFQRNTMLTQDDVIFLAVDWLRRVSSEVIEEKQNEENQ